MKIPKTLSNLMTNKYVLYLVAGFAFFNIFGYMALGNINAVIFFILVSYIMTFFSKNMIIVLGVPLVFVNIFSLKNNTYSVEGMENNDDQKHSETINKINDEKQKKQSPMLPGTDHPINNSEEIGASNETKTDEHFEVGRPKNGGSKIDYAATIEGAYDELNNILGSEGIKNLTDDTQRLMKQQMELAQSMNSLGPMVEKMMPMAKQMQGMMEGMNGNGGMSNLMDMAKKMAQGLGNNATKTP
jgi:hypothetical protein